MTDGHNRKFLMRQYGYDDRSLEYFEKAGYEKMLLRRQIERAKPHEARSHAHKFGRGGD